MMRDRKLNSSDRPLGIRQNNPGNLIKTNIPWRGKVQQDQVPTRYEAFTHPVYGIRAMFMDVRGDIEKDGLNTLEKLLAEYAPTFENNLPAYIASVSQRTGLAPAQPITPDYYLSLLKAIIHHENGEQPYTDDEIQEAMDLA